MRTLSIKNFRNGKYIGIKNRNKNYDDDDKYNNNTNNLASAINDIVEINKTKKDANKKIYKQKNISNMPKKNNYIVANF